MGGIGSGALRSAKIGNVEDMLTLDIRALRRLGVVRAGECVIDTVQWLKRGPRASSARLRSDLSTIERGGTMTIIGDMPDGAISQHIAVEAVPSAFGGHRCYFICPISAERCEVLYYARGRFASRGAQGLTYAAQNMTDLSRACRKVAKLHSRLCGSGGQPIPRGRNRNELVERRERAKAEARAHFIDRLHNHVDRSGSRY